MMNGAGFLWIVFFSMVILKRRFHRQHLLAFLFILGGVTMVGVASFTNQDPAKRHESRWMGFVFILFTQIFGALFYISEELLFVKYHLNPLKVAGWEGVWGTLIYSVILVILQFIECTGKLCPQGRLDNSERTFEQFGDNSWLILFTICLLITHCLYNGFGVSVTKYASSASRSTMNSCKTAVVWVFFLIYRGPGHETFLWLQFFGFIILILGTLIFNEIIVIPLFGFNTNLRKHEKAKMGRSGRKQ
jgi:drug/metabolite transporter (DMT)-like permease